MKELSIEEKAKAYDEALKRANELLYVSDKESLQRKTIESIFPEFKESEDEKIRKTLIKYFRNCISLEGINGEDISNWLEKQGNLMKALQISNARIGELIEKNYYLKEQLEKQGEHANFLSKIQVGDKVTRNEDGVLVNLSQLARVAKPAEEQGEQKHIVPKFKVGDWVIDKQGIVHQIANVIEIVTCHTYGYDIVGGGYFNDNTEGVRLWTVQDAKDGDVLVSESNCGLGTWYCIFKSLDDDESMTVYCYLAMDGRFETKKELCFDKDPFNTKPATKEQRDTLERAMAEAGYEWDAEKKELKKVEQKSWSEEDEKMLNHIIGLLEGLPNLHNWLKSLKERYTWKPSDEQIEALEHFVRSIGESGYASPYDNNTKLLYSLLSDLKKLKE